MLVYGGTLQNGQITGELLSFDLEFYDWTRIQYKQTFEPLTQAAWCTVITAKKGALGHNEPARLSDQVLDGVYLFGGKNSKGELQNRLRFMRPTVSEGKVLAVEWNKIKQ